MTDPTQSIAMARITTIALPLVLILGAFGSPGLAKQGLERGQKAVEVSYADLDLTKAEGQAALDRRINEAAANVCRTGFSRSVRIATETRECIANAKARIAPVRSEIIAEAQARAARRNLAANPR